VKYMKQFLIVLLFSYLGELLQRWIPLPIPAVIYGLLLMLLALCTGLVKPKHIADVSPFLISLLPLFFVAPAAGILQHWDILAPNVVKIIVIILISTCVVFAVSGLVCKWLQKIGGKSNG